MQTSALYTSQGEIRVGHNLATLLWINNASFCMLHWDKRSADVAANLGIQFRKMTETSENTSGSRGSISLRRKYLDLYTVELRAKGQTVVHAGARRASRCGSHEGIAQGFYLT